MSTDPSIDSTNVEDLRTQVAALQSQLEAERRGRATRTRSVFAWILATLAVLATVLALLSIWTLRTLTDTDLFVDRVGSVIEDPAVAQEIGDRAAAELVNALDLQTRIAQALPDQATVVAGPITTAAQNYLAEGTTRLIETDQFQQAWDRALTTSHRLAIGVLSGTDRTAITNDDGSIVLNITPVVNALLGQGSEFVSQLLNKQISAPTVTTDDIDAATAALEQALGVDLPSSFGEITLFSSEDLAAAQQYYSAMRIAVWLTPLIALMLIGLALAVSPRRLRTFLGIVIAVALLLLFVGLTLTPLQNQIVAAVPDQGLAQAVGAGFSTVTSSLLSGITVIAIIGVLAALVFFLTGDNRPARAAREAMGQAPSLAARHRGVFLAGGAVLALILLALIPGRSLDQFLIVGLLYAGYALAVLLAAHGGQHDAEAPVGSAQSA